MSARSYLSIGDVLTLLRQEFPDVTISKIRFLESQGLVNPERTPSGYRKFYEHDVERLRWVLRQQRENFLPLKVIKDRLDDEQAEDGAIVPPADAPSARAEEPVLVGHRAAGEQHATTTHRAARARNPRVDQTAAVAVGTDGQDHAPVAPAVDGVTLPGIEPEAPAPSGSPAGAGAPGNGSTPPTTTTTGRGGRAGSHRDGAVLDGTSESPPAPPASRQRGPAGRSGSAPRPSGPGPAGDRPEPATSAASRTGAPTGPATAAGGGEVSEPEAAPTGGRSTSTLSIDEVAAGSGLDVAVVEELVAYGLVSCTSVAGLDCFDEGAVAVATLAAGFARFGIEPRHLRLYKNAADREAGFIEQIVLPLLRQRNPEARVRANETADELARLGQQLRSSLVRTALGGLLDS